jgi:hypothetical protein
MIQSATDVRAVLAAITPGSPGNDDVRSVEVEYKTCVATAYHIGTLPGPRRIST